MDLTFHGTDDQLELYALGRSAASELPVLEEHLMVCVVCRERLDQVESFALSMREALGMDAAPVPSTSKKWTSIIGLNWMRKPAFSMALGFAALVLAIVVFSGGKTKVAPIAALQLTAIRGEMPLSDPAREIDLTLADAPAAGGPFRIDVLDAGGQREWSGLAATGTRGVAVKIQRRLQPGYYFVRLYDAGGAVLHEYGFRVRG